LSTDDALRLHVATMREMWGLADYEPLAKLLEPAAAALIGHVQPVAGARILDLAAGTGNVAALAAERGAESVACDLSPRMIRAGKLRMAAAEGSPVRWVEADMENLPLAAGTVDLALSSFGLIYAPRPAWALREVHRVLAPHGCLAFTAWTPAGFMGEAIRLLRECIPPTPWIADTLDLGPRRCRQQLADHGRLRRRLDTPPTTTLGIPLVAVDDGLLRRSLSATPRH